MNSPRVRTIVAVMLSAWFLAALAHLNRVAHAPSRLLELTVSSVLALPKPAPAKPMVAAAANYGWPERCLITSAEHAWRMPSLVLDGLVIPLGGVIAIVCVSRRRATYTLSELLLLVLVVAVTIRLVMDGRHGRQFVGPVTDVLAAPLWCQLGVFVGAAAAMGLIASVIPRVASMLQQERRP